jgi:hypothetical protein
VRWTSALRASEYGSSHVAPGRAERVVFAFPELDLHRLDHTPKKPARALLCFIAPCDRKPQPSFQLRHFSPRIAARCDGFLQRLEKDARTRRGGPKHCTASRPSLDEGLEPRRHIITIIVRPHKSLSKWPAARAAGQTIDTRYSPNPSLPGSFPVPVP